MGNQIFNMNNFNMNKMYIKSQMQSLSNQVPLGMLGTVAFGSTPEERLKGLMRKEKSELEAGSLDKESSPETEKEGGKKKKKNQKKGKAQTEKKRAGQKSDSREGKQAGVGVSGDASNSMMSGDVAASGKMAARGRNSGDSATYGRASGNAAAYAGTRGGMVSRGEFDGAFSPELLREAVVWSEILGEPVSRQRRKRRIVNVKQGHAGPG